MCPKCLIYISQWLWICLMCLKWPICPKFPKRPKCSKCPMCLNCPCVPNVSCVPNDPCVPIFPCVPNATCVTNVQCVTNVPCVTNVTCAQKKTALQILIENISTMANINHMGGVVVIYYGSPSVHRGGDMLVYFCPLSAFCLSVCFHSFLSVCPELSIVKHETLT